jgi:acyl-CoA reductase-like NAD-dependent aldehyde dehydrogenase
MDDLLKRLDADGATGADLSPGDPVCKAAAARIRALEAVLREARPAIEHWGSPDLYERARVLLAQR